jgi:hypothetical protein
MTLIDGLTIFKGAAGPDWKRTLALEERIYSGTENFIA